MDVEREAMKHRPYKILRVRWSTELQNLEAGYDYCATVGPTRTEEKVLPRGRGVDMHELGLLLEKAIRRIVRKPPAMRSARK